MSRTEYALKCLKNAEARKTSRETFEKDIAQKVINKEKMMMKMLGFILSAMLISSNAMAGLIYSEDFDPAPTIESTFNAQLGGNTLAVNHKYLDFGVWARTTNGALVDDGSGTNNVLRAHQADITNVRMVGVYIDPALFGSAGTYTLSFDVIGADAGIANVFIYAGSGYDLTGATDAKLVLSLSAGGFAAYTGLTGQNGATASQLATANFNPTVSQTVKLDFVYDGSSAIAVAIGGYNTALLIDNVQVIPEPATLGLFVGSSALLLMIRKITTR